MFQVHMFVLMINAVSLYKYIKKKMQFRSLKMLFEDYLKKLSIAKKLWKMSHNNE